MSAYPVSSHIYPATYFRRFTDFDPAVVLHADSANGGSAPTDINHLPMKALVEVTTADTVLAVTDVTGTTTTINFDAVGLHVLEDFAPVTIEATTTVAAVTVFWTQKT